MALTSESIREATFVTAKEGGVRVRMVDSSVNTLWTIAKNLEASHVVCHDGLDPRTGDPVWAVFEVARFSKLGSLGRSLPLAMRTFSNEDAAVMYALARRAMP